MTFFYSCTLRRKMKCTWWHTVGHLNLQECDARHEGATSLKLSICFKDAAIHSLTGSIILQSSFKENVSGHCEEITWTFNDQGAVAVLTWVNKFQWEISFLAFISVSSFKCASGSRVSGAAHQQLQYQRVLGAAASQQPERHCSGV